MDLGTENRVESVPQKEFYEYKRSGRCGQACAMLDMHERNTDL